MVSIFNIMGLPILSAKPRTFSKSKMSRRRWLGHFQMELDEREDRLALLGIEVEPGQEGVGQLDALAGVLAGATSLPVSCNSSASRNRSRRVDLRQELGQALFVVVNGLAQAVHVVRW